MKKIMVGILTMGLVAGTALSMPEPGGMGARLCLGGNLTYLTMEGGDSAFMAGAALRVDFDLGHARKVQVVNNRFASERGQLTIRDCREVLLKGNRLGQEALPATHIQVQDEATRDSLRKQ